MNSDYQFYHELKANAEAEGSPFTWTIQAGHDGHSYHIFSYRIGSYSDFAVSPNARWSRGAMFRVEQKMDGVAINLVSLPMKKFWNQGEALQADIPGDELDVVMSKLDGSLISSYLDITGKLCVKSKASLHSEHALAAQELLDTSFQDLHNSCKMAELDGYTVNMEWTSPANQIVLQYDTDALTVLSMTHRETRKTILQVDPEWPSYMLKKYNVKMFDCTDPSPVNLMEQVKLWKDCEGTVVRMKSGEYKKMKAADYVAKHGAFGKLTNLHQAVAMVLAEVSDDLRAMFVDRPLTIKLLDRAEEFVSAMRKDLDKTIADFMHENEHLSIKDYAIKAQAEFKDSRFSMLMSAKRQKEFQRRDQYILTKAKEVSKKIYNIVWNGDPVDTSNGLRDCYVCDIDGTVAARTDRGPYEWHRVGEDVPAQDVIDVVNTLADAGNDIILVTGRDAACADKSVQWANQHGIKFCALVARLESDNRSDAIVKEEIYKQCIFPTWKVKGVFDDRNRVVDKLREMGLRVYQVQPGNF